MDRFCFLQTGRQVIFPFIPVFVLNWTNPLLVANTDLSNTDTTKVSLLLHSKEESKLMYIQIQNKFIKGYAPHDNSL